MKKLQLLQITSELKWMVINVRVRERDGEWEVFLRSLGKVPQSRTNVEGLPTESIEEIHPI